VKATKQSIGKAVDQPDASVRFYLLYGPDEAQSRALGSRLLEALKAERFIVAGGAVKADPAVLADAAGAMNLFGGRRVIWIEPAGEEIAEGVEALLEANGSESPVVAIAGALRKTSGLLKLAEASRPALACASYVPEGADAERMVIDVARRYGLKVDPRLANRIAESCGSDQAVVSQELQKLALYVGASPQTPKGLEEDALEAIGAEIAEGNIPRVADLALAGEVKELIEELAKLPTGTEGIPVVRALQRRLLMLSPARARMNQGESLDAVMTSLDRALFWKDKPLVSKLLSLWDSRRLATVAERASRLERELVFTDIPNQAALGEELVAIARAAGRR